MTLSSRPLLDNTADAALFVGREREVALLDLALAQRLNVLLAGDSGIGKTSLLRHQMHCLRTDEGRADHYVTTYVRAEGVSESVDLLAMITRATLGLTETPSGPSSDLVAALRGRHDEIAGQAEEQALVQVLFVDDVSAAAGHGLFGRLRDELWSLGYIWVVATRDQAGLLLPPADAFFERVVEMAPLSPEEATRVVEARRGAPATEWAATLSRAVGGNPRRLLAFVRDFLAGDESFRPLLESLAARDAAIQRLGRSEAMLAAELGALGRASASDAALLDRLGWTRSRAVQVLQRLERAGLVVGDEVKSGPGRPRKVYRLTSPPEYIEWLRTAEDGR